MAWRSATAVKNLLQRIAALTPDLEKQPSLKQPIGRRAGNLESQISFPAEPLQSMPELSIQRPRRR